MRLRKLLRKYLYLLKLVLKVPFRFICTNIKNFSRAMRVSPLKSRNPEGYVPAAAWSLTPFLERVSALLFSLPLLQTVFCGSE